MMIVRLGDKSIGMVKIFKIILKEMFLRMVKKSTVLHDNLIRAIILNCFLKNW